MLLKKEISSMPMPTGQSLSEVFSFVYSSITQLQQLITLLGIAVIY